MGYQMFRTRKGATQDLKHSLELLMENMDDMNAHQNYETFNVIRVGRLLEGKAFYHETDETYTCVGFEVEIESRFDFDGKLSDMSKDVGFYAIWRGRASETAPFIFDESFVDFGKSFTFTNGYGDHFEVTKVLATAKEVAESQ